MDDFKVGDTVYRADVNYSGKVEMFSTTVVAVTDKQFRFAEGNNTTKYRTVLRKPEAKQMLAPSKLWALKTLQRKIETRQLTLLDKQAQATKDLTSVQRMIEEENH